MAEFDEDLIVKFNPKDGLKASDLELMQRNLYSFICENFVSTGEGPVAPTGALSDTGGEVSGPICYGTEDKDGDEEAEIILATDPCHLVTLQQVTDMISSFCQCWSDRASVVSDADGLICIPVPAGHFGTITGALASPVALAGVPAQGSLDFAGIDANGDVCYTLYDINGQIWPNHALNISYIIMGRP